MSTLNELKEMDDNRLNMLVALMCGWEDVGSSKKDNWLPRGLSPNIGDRGVNNSRTPIPKYSTDLTAMFEAQSKLYELPDGATQRFVMLLPDACEGGWSTKIEKCTFAGARERAIAFIRTMEWHSEMVEEDRRSRMGDNYTRGPAPNPYVWG